MQTKDLIHTWFSLWESGDFQQLPLANHFKHTSPFGTIDGKVAYMDLVEANRDKFLGHRFELHDIIVDGNRAAVRYTTHWKRITMDVSEWFLVSDGLIDEIVSYYNVESEMPEDRKLKDAS